MAHVIIKGLKRIGLFMLGFVFVINSSLHSYLILAINNFECVTMDVGFYYLSNAASRLTRTFLSDAISWGFASMSFLDYHTMFIVLVVYILSRNT